MMALCWLFDGYVIGFTLLGCPGKVAEEKAAASGVMRPKTESASLPPRGWAAYATGEMAKSR